MILAVASFSFLPPKAHLEEIVESTLICRSYREALGNVNAILRVPHRINAEVEEGEFITKDLSSLI